MSENNEFIQEISRLFVIFFVAYQTGCDVDLDDVRAAMQILREAGFEREVQAIEEYFAANI